MKNKKMNAARKEKGIYIRSGKTEDEILEALGYLICLRLEPDESWNLRIQATREINRLIKALGGYNRGEFVESFEGRAPIRAQRVSIKNGEIYYEEEQ